VSSVGLSILVGGLAMLALLDLRAACRRFSHRL